MTTIVISDIHNSVDWIESTLAELYTKYTYDEVVFLGDYFDSFGDNFTHALKTAKWLKQSLEQKNRVHLMGNHDMPYRFPYNEAVWCPGYHPSKKETIRSVLTAEDWDKCKGAYYSNGFVFSHAGFHPDVITCPVTGPLSPEALVSAAADGLEQIKSGLANALYLPGSRMGEARIGGITWADWDDEAVVYPGISQVVGHTPGKFVRELQTPEDVMFALDTRNKHIGVIIDGKITFIPNTHELAKPID